jgi:1,4-dihydroxy-2-naphthoyl-CoA hydrolase
MSKKNEMDLEAIRKTFSGGALHNLMGIKVHEVSADSLSLKMTVSQQHLRPGNIMNGGVSLLLIETAGSFSAYRTINTETHNALGIQVNANHTAVAFPGDVLIAKSRAVHLGKTTHIWDVDITNQNNKLVSSGRVTLIITQKN